MNGISVLAAWTDDLDLGLVAASFLVLAVMAARGIAVGRRLRIRIRELEETRKGESRRVPLAQSPSRRQ